MAITQEMIQTYQHPRFRLVIGTLTIDEDAIIPSSFSYKAGTTAGGAFAPGGCVVSQCSFAVRNGSGEYSSAFPEGAEVAVYVGYGPSVAEATYDLLCTVYVAEVARRSGRLTVTCHDALRRADKKKWTSYSFPMTVSEIITSAATEAGITVSQLPAEGGSISVDLREDGAQPDLAMTCRQAMANALLISGNYGLMSPAGGLLCGWYGTGVDASIDVGWLFDYEMQDADAYTGVQVAGQAVTGTDTVLYVLSSNAFLTEGNASAVQARLYDALVGVSVPRVTLSAILNPGLRPGMTAQVTYPQAGTMMTTVFPLMDVSAHGGMLASYSSSNVVADIRDDMRVSGRDATESLARGDYATKRYVDDAISQGGGGGGDEASCDAISIAQAETRIPTSSDAALMPSINRGSYTGVMWDASGGMREYDASGHAVVILQQSVVIPKLVTTREDVLIPLRVTYTYNNETSASYDTCVVFFPFEHKMVNNKETLAFKYSLNTLNPPWAEVLTHEASGSPPALRLYHVPMNLWRLGSTYYYRPLQGLRDTGSTSPATGGGIRIWEWY